jgi:predicted PurR-regulated permease PerM
MSEATSTDVQRVPARPLRQHALAVVTFGLLAAVVLWAALRILLPFLTPLLLALIIVTFTYPLYRRLRARFGGRSGAAAAVMLLGITVILFLPAVGLIVMLVEQATQLVALLQNTDFTALQESLKLDERLAFFAEWLPGFRPDAIDLDRVVLTIVQQIPAFIAGYGAKFLGGFAGVIIGFFLMLLAAFFFYTHGSRIVTELKFLSPLPDEYDEEIINKFRGVVDATFRGQVLTSLAQGLVTGVGLAIAQVPAPVLWGTVAVVFGLIPLLGAAMIWVPAAAYLLLLASMGRMAWGYGIFLLIWGVAVVSLVDNVIRPWAMRSGTNMHAIVLFFSILGGVSAFGFVGIILGPLVFALLVTVIAIYRDFFQRPLQEQNKGLVPKDENPQAAAADQSPM